MLKGEPSTESYTLSLHDALPICEPRREGFPAAAARDRCARGDDHFDRRGDAAGDDRPHAVRNGRPDRKSTRLNSSHVKISYAVFCLKKKKIMRSRQHKRIYTLSQ